jgi:hypothetical protein
MTVRTGTSDLIRRLRGMGQVSAEQYTIDLITWWSDDHVQEVLDMYRTDYYYEPLRPVADIGTGGSVEYFNYYAPSGSLEKNTSGTVYFSIETAAGSAIGTALYSVDYITGLIRFTSNQSGTPYYLRARAYNLNASAAEIWRNKAAHYADEYNFQSDNQRFDRAVRIKNALQMADYWDAKGGISNGLRVSKMTRTDLRIGMQTYRYPNSDGNYTSVEDDE